MSLLEKLAILKSIKGIFGGEERRKRERKDMEKSGKKDGGLRMQGGVTGIDLWVFLPLLAAAAYRYNSSHSGAILRPLVRPDFRCVASPPFPNSLNTAPQSLYKKKKHRLLHAFPISPTIRTKLTSTMSTSMSISSSIPPP